MYRRIIIATIKTFIMLLLLIQSRLVYCKAPKWARPANCKMRGAPITATIGKVGYQSKLWIRCRPNHSVAYATKVRVRGTLGPCNKQVLTVLVQGQWMVSEFFDSSQDWVRQGCGIAQALKVVPSLIKYRNDVNEIVYQNFQILIFNIFLKSL